MSLVSSMLGDLKEGFSLPITRRGLFSQDDFFQGFQKDYSTAVEDVLNRWGSRTSQADRFASYRRLREKDTSDDSLAATISDTGDSYVIVVDMSEYANGQITVETVQCSAVVEGKCGPKCYKRQFPLPSNTITDRVVADLSDESILTVSAPRKGEKVIAINTDSTQPKTSGGNATDSSSSVSSIEAQIIPTESQSALASSSTTTAEGRVIPLNVEGETATCAATQAIKSEALASSERRSSQTRIIPLNIEGKTSSQTQTTIASASGTATGTGTVVTERIIPSTIEGQQSIYSSSSSRQNRVLPINRRGRFFQDATFENVWKDFESAIDDLVARRGSHAGMEQDKDRFQSYRNLRKVVQHDDNQAATVSKESNEFKIVVDVKDFVDGHLDVKAVQGAVVVSGRKGPCSFERRFSIAGLTQPDKVSAAISTDGVLTITAPV